MTDRPGRRTSVYLPAELAARVDASDLPLARIIARGLDCTGHAGNPVEELSARLDIIEQRQADHERNHPNPCQHQAAAAKQASRLRHWADALPDNGSITARQASQAWGVSQNGAHDRLAQLTIAGYLTELPSRVTVGNGHGGAPARVWERANRA
jgi:hypothetical protein